MKELTTLISSQNQAFSEPESISQTKLNELIHIKYHKSLSEYIENPNLEQTFDNLFEKEKNNVFYFSNL